LLLGFSKRERNSQHRAQNTALIKNNCIESATTHGFKDFPKEVEAAEQEL
jgi:hypothetical protein